MSTSASKQNPVDPDWLQLGQHVGHYEVQKRVASGGFGALYQVSRDGLPFALKIPLPERLVDEERDFTEERIEREVATLLSVRHPNIVKVREFFRWPDSAGYVCIVMDFIDGYPLYEWRKRTNPSAKRIVEVFRKIALALQEMHQRAILHRDIKSANVLVRTSDGEPMLIDFGLSRPESGHTMTQVGALLGTFSHWSPEYCRFYYSEEFARGERFPYSPTSDLYSLGFMFYECITGRAPHDASSQAAHLQLFRAERQAKPPSYVNPRTPSGFDDVVLKLLASKPEDRYQEARELVEALDRLLERAGTGDEAWESPLDVPPRPLPGSHTAIDRRAGTPSPASSVVGPAAPSLPSAGSASASVALSDTVPPAQASSAEELSLTSDVPGAPPSAALPAVGPPPPPVSSGHAPPSSASLPPPSAVAQSPAPAPSGIASTGFSPPSAMAAVFAADVSTPTAAPEAPVGGLPSGIVAARRRLDASTAAGARGKLPFLLGGAALVLAVVGIFAVAANSGPAPVARPRSLLDEAQAAVAAPAQSIEAVQAEPQVPAAGAQAVEAAPVEAVAASPEEAPSVAPASVAPKPPAAAGPRNRTPNPDERQIDTLLAAEYGRPSAPGAAAKPAAPAGPAWLKRGQQVGQAAKPQSTARGIPLGAEIMARLSKPLDSRTVGDGPVVARLPKAFAVRGAVALPTGTMVYGTASAGGAGRFTVHFTHLRLPDNTELPFDGLAMDRGDNKPGLAASRRISVADNSPGLGEKLAKGAAGTLLGKVSGNEVADVARGAGETVLGHGADATSKGEALLLDEGANFTIFVSAAF